MPSGIDSVQKASSPALGVLKKKPSTGNINPSSLKLERIIGSTVNNLHSFQLHPSLLSSISRPAGLPPMVNLASDGNNSMFSELAAYVAGTIVVLYNIKKNKQIKFLEHPASNKPFSCLAFSRDGQYLAAGEKGHKPTIIVWDLHKVLEAATSEEEKPRICFELKSKDKGHQQEVKDICFSKDGKMLISVGFENELKIWELIPGSSAVSSNTIGKGELKFSKSVDPTNAIMLSPCDDTGFITAGSGFVRFWSYSKTQKTSLLSVRSMACNLDCWGKSNFVSLASRGK